MSRIDAPQPAVPTSSMQAPTSETPTMHREFGLPWSDDYVLVIDPDGGVSVDSGPPTPDQAIGLTCSTKPRGFRRKFRFTGASHGGWTVYNALQARDWALGRDCGCSGSESFPSKQLVLPRGPQWDQAIHTALLGDWADPLTNGGRIDPSVLSRIKSDAQTIHRQLVPIWRRRVRRSRVLLLETQLGDNLTLHDLVAGELRMDDLVFEAAFDDERINAVLAQLDPAERRVAMAWAHPTIATWTEAARFAGAASPEAYGERVRRKLKRLGNRYTARSHAAATRDGAR
ncbi:hypothetical protein [Streptosporangium sandarakinum]|uniref:hypothetical protein n=1 Tax=Streptosporangium sandarakinum TaxID=1260955 RepID=UPI003710E78E